ncbi:hypothetical protein BD289DRAFT_366224 [Coniella lustricola]|uniref:non-specific serine/threonine protein kinase n=1 Tax=Coniella lustricola TaxID=2025994 RepID=A0A2T3AB83_9PEZI|nr:hypothetical protein BD289DRAFT_366224 [Coniella lustricola]
MASYGPPSSAAVSRHGQPVAYGAPVVPVLPGGPAPPAGTFSPGTKIQVGSHRVVIQKYLSEGGFAHVYLVKMPQPIDGTDVAVLKRVAVPDKEALKGMRTEVETMKRLKGHRPIVTYIDSHASELRGGGYEVFLLMEFCNGGGLIDFMNTRLQHRLTEPEILQIFADVAEGVACMHYLKPPLLHRDLKVENVLITNTGSKKKFKLCDFGSAAVPRPAPTTVTECRLVEEDVQKHTTMQYRSPEMVDVYRKQPIDEKSDIWALGVLLYKLCYYTTPFEEQGQLAILNASYRFPNYPAFSDRIKKLIASMLREHPQTRPNIFQVLHESCAMQGREVPIKDIYSSKSKSETRHRESPPQAAANAALAVGAVFSPPTQQEQKIPDIAPMRRGRLPASTPQVSQHPKPSPSPMPVTNGDPFAALDSKAVAKSKDELSSRFPTLDQFSILHEKGLKFDFEATGSPVTVGEPNEKSSDNAFNITQGLPPAAETSRVVPASLSTSPEKGPLKPSEMSRASEIIMSTPELQAISSGSAQVFQPSPTRPIMVSTGTMTSPPVERQNSKTPSQYPIYRFPDRHRSSSLTRSKEASLPSRKDSPKIRTSTSFLGHVRHVSSSSRPSLEGGRPSMENIGEPLSNAASAPGRSRPVSTHLESNLDFLRERESISKPLASPALPSPSLLPVENEFPLHAVGDGDETNIESNVDFLRSMEDYKPRKSEESKRTSLSSLGKKSSSILAGKFGDAFKRFESSQPGAPPGRTPSPSTAIERRDLTPIAGSEATDGRSDDGQTIESDSMTPEMRREMERRQLADEERRVAVAQAEYRARMASRVDGGKPAPPPVGGSSRAVAIQNKVQSLLDENARSSANIKKTAEGYGQYTAAPSEPTQLAQPMDSRPDIPRKPIAQARGAMTPPRPGSYSPSLNSRIPNATPKSSADLSSRPPVPPKDTKPMAPPKPLHLNKTSGSGYSSLTSPSPTRAAVNTTGMRQTGRLEALVAADLPGQPALDMTAQEKDDYLRDFSKRFPSLTSIEMVERDLAAEEGNQTGR